MTEYNNTSVSDQGEVMKDRKKKQSRLKAREEPADEANIYNITQPLMLQFTYALHLVVHFLVL